MNARTSSFWNLLGGASLLLGLLAQAACSGPSSTGPPATSSLALEVTDACGGGSVPLLAGQSQHVGFVHVTHDSVTLQITIELSGATLLESHVAIATSVDGIPQTRSGNPKVGHFPFHRSYEGGTVSDTYTIALADLGLAPDEADCADQDIVIAVHAEVEGTGEGALSGAESAWAAGTGFPGKSWATWFDYGLNCCCAEDCAVVRSSFYGACLSLLDPNTCAFAAQVSEQVCNDTVSCGGSSCGATCQDGALQLGAICAQLGLDPAVCAQVEPFFFRTCLLEICLEPPCPPVTSGALATATLASTSAVAAATEMAACGCSGLRYGESSGGFCCGYGYIEDNTCKGSGSVVCALDPSRTQGNPLCHCPENTARFADGNAYCCGGNVTGGGSSCDAGVCAKDPANAPGFPYCAACPEGFTRYNANYCCDGPVVNGQCNAAAVCKLDPNDPNALPLCSDTQFTRGVTCPEGMDRYLGTYCCDGVVAADGNSCTAHPERSPDTLVCSTSRDSAFGNSECNRKVCPDGMAVYADYFCCDGTTNGSSCSGNVCFMPPDQCPAGTTRYAGNYCCAGTTNGFSCAGTVCSLLADDPSGNPQCGGNTGNPVCGGGCPRGSVAYGRERYDMHPTEPAVTLGQFCCDGALAADGLNCVAGADAKAPNVCAMTVPFDAQGFAACEVQADGSLCPPGFVDYGNGRFCCDGTRDPNTYGMTCVGATKICSRRFNTQGNPSCASVVKECPSSMQPYLGGKFCCGGEVVNDAGCADRPLVCSLLANDPSGNPSCGNVGCPAGMTKYGNGNYCCAGTVSGFNAQFPDGGVCAPRVQSCTTSQAAVTAALPLCGTTAFDRTGGTPPAGSPADAFTAKLTVGTGDGAFSLEATGGWTENADGSLKPLGKLRISGAGQSVDIDIVDVATTAAQLKGLEELKVFLNPLGITGTVTAQIPFGQGPSATLSLLKGSQFPNGQIELGAETFDANPTHYYFVFRFAGAASIDVPGGAIELRDGPEILLVIDPLEPLTYLDVSGAPTPFGILDAGLGFSAGGGLSLTTQRTIWNWTNGNNTNKYDATGHVYVRGALSLKVLSLDGKMLFNYDKNKGTAGDTGTWMDGDCGDFELAGDASLGGEIPMGKLDPIALTLSGSVILTGNYGGDCQYRVDNNLEPRNELQFSAGVTAESTFEDSFIGFLNPYGGVEIWGRYVEPTNFNVAANFQSGGIRPKIAGYEVDIPAIGVPGGFWLFLTPTTATVTAQSSIKLSPTHTANGVVTITVTAAETANALGTIRFQGNFSVTPNATALVIDETINIPKVGLPPEFTAIAAGLEDFVEDLTGVVIPPTAGPGGYCTVDTGCSSWVAFGNHGCCNNCCVDLVPGLFGVSGCDLSQSQPACTP